MGYILNTGVQGGGIPLRLVQAFTNYVDVPNFIESGTSGGDSVRAVSYLFNRCDTIEIISGIENGILPKSNIKQHIGNSVDILPSLIDKLISEKQAIQEQNTDEDIYHYCMFWLDSHWCEPYKNDTGNKECPLLEELEIISRYQADAIILIDDLRLFIGNPPAPNDPRQWPTIQEIFKLLNDKFPFNVNTIRDDYILSFPSRLSEPIDEEWSDNFKIRYPDASDKLKVDVKNVYNALLNYMK